MSHRSHDTRYSDSSLYDEVCKNCGATDAMIGGTNALERPCPKAKRGKMKKISPDKAVGREGAPPLLRRRVAVTYVNPEFDATGSAALRPLLLANLYHTLNTGYGLGVKREIKDVFIQRQLRKAGATQSEIETLLAE